MLAPSIDLHKNYSLKLQATVLICSLSVLNFSQLVIWVGWILFMCLSFSNHFWLRQELRESQCLSVCQFQSAQSSSLSQVSQVVSGLLKVSISALLAYFVGLTEPELLSLVHFVLIPDQRRVWTGRACFCPRRSQTWCRSWACRCSAWSACHPTWPRGCSGAGYAQPGNNIHDSRKSVLQRRFVRNLMSSGSSIGP